MIKLKNKILSVIMCIVFLFGVVAFVGCNGKEQSGDIINENQQEQQEQQGQEQQGGNQQEGGQQEQKKEEVSVVSLAQENFAGIDFSNNYNLAVNGVVEKKYSKNKIKEIVSSNIEIGEQGKITIIAKVLDDQSQVKTNTFEVEMDTSDLESFKDFSADSVGKIAEIIAENGYDANSKIEKDSNEYNEFVSVLNAEKTKYNQGFETVKNISASEIKETKEKIIEYVSVQDIVSEIFGNMDIPADMKALADKLTKTYTTAVNLGSLLAVDFDMNNGNIIFVAKRKSVNVVNYSVSTATISFNKSDIKNIHFINCVKNLQNEIDNILKKNNVTKESSLEKDSSKESALKKDLNDLKTGYDESLENFKQKTKTEIKMTKLFDYVELSDEQKQNIGVTNMNDFAYALLNNKKGTDYAKVSGFKYEDVIETFVDRPTTDDVFGYSRYSVYVLTEDGVFQNAIRTQRLSSQDKRDRYGLLINDSNNVTIISSENIFNLSFNAVNFNVNNKAIQTKSLEITK